MSQVIDAAAKLSEAEDAVTAPLADSHIVTFADGVTIGTVLYTEAELRELTARDLIDAQEASEKSSARGTPSRSFPPPPAWGSSCCADR